MKKLILFFGLILTMNMQVNAQEEQELTYHQLVMQYLTVNGTVNQYDDAFGQLMSMLKQQYRGHQVKETEWAMLADEKEKELLIIRSLLSSVYRSMFNRGDIENMVEFYSSPSGQAFVGDPTNLSNEDKTNLSDFYSSVTGQMILQNKPELDRLVSEVSEMWSKDLYKKMTEKLSVLGYNL